MRKRWDDQIYQIQTQYQSSMYETMEEEMAIVGSIWLYLTLYYDHLVLSDNILVCLTLRVYVFD